MQESVTCLLAHPISTTHDSDVSLQHSHAHASKRRSLLLGALWRQERGRINAWRGQSLGLPPLAGGPMPVIEGAGGAIPVVMMVSCQ